MKLKDFRKQLEFYRKEPSDDLYDNRITHCYLTYNHKGKDHYFEVRGWNKIKDNKLFISVVNWTLCAGTASLELTEDRCDSYKITENYPG
jgi:hypothetical protein